MSIKIIDNFSLLLVQLCSPLYIIECVRFMRNTFTLYIGCPNNLLPRISPIEKKLFEIFLIKILLIIIVHMVHHVKSSKQKRRIYDTDSQ